MLRKAIVGYYRFFDETLSSTTFIVLIITLLIFIVGSIIPAAHANSLYMKGNILETAKSDYYSKQNTTRITIDGVEYEITFQEVK